MLDKSSPVRPVLRFHNWRIRSQKLHRKRGGGRPYSNYTPLSFIEPPKFPDLLRHAENESRIEIRKIRRCENRRAIAAAPDVLGSANHPAIRQYVFELLDAFVGDLRVCNVHYLQV